MAAIRSSREWLLAAGVVGRLPEVWTRRHGELAQIGVEGTGTYGAAGAPEARGFTRDLDLALGDGVFDEAFGQGG